MSDTITISINELRALLRKAFEGVFGHSRDWNAMADTVIWLECNNFGGMKVFFEVYSELDLGRKVSLADSSDDEILLIGNGTSFLEFSHLLGDLLLVAAKEKGWAKARISKAKHPDVLQAVNDRISRAGFGAGYTLYNDDIVFEVSSNGPQSQNSAERYHDILDRGYSMSRTNYKKLCGYADKVLVPATEQSRRGAGE